MKILVIGAGMYVTGRNNTGPGTVLASLCQFSKKHPVDLVTIAAKSKAGQQWVASKADQLNRDLTSQVKVEYAALGDDIPAAISALTAKVAYDCALVAVPDHLHHAYTKELLLNRLHCLVVKPFTPSLSEAMELTRIQEQSGLIGMVEFHKRLDESNLYTKGIIQEALLGDLLYFVVEYSQRISIPLSVFRGWADRTNIFQYLGVHYVDLIYFLTGFRPTRAMAVGTRGVLQQRGLDTFDSVHATVLWQHPADLRKTIVSQFATNWIDPETTTALSDQKYKLIGTRGRIELDQKARGIELVTQGRGPLTVNPYFSEFMPECDGGLRFDGYGYRSIERFLLDVLAAREGSLQPPSPGDARPSFRQALVSTAVIEAINASLQTNGTWSQIDALF